MDDDVVVRREERGLISVLTMEYRPSTKPWRAPSPRKAWLDLKVVQCGYCQAGQIMAIRKDQQFSCANSPVGIGHSPSEPVIRRFGTREMTPEDLEREADRLEKMVARGGVRSRNGVVEQD